MSITSMSLLAYLSGLAYTDVFVNLLDCLARLTDYAMLKVSNNPSLLAFMTGIQFQSQWTCGFYSVLIFQCINSDQVEHGP